MAQSSVCNTYLTLAAERLTSRLSGEEYVVGRWDRLLPKSEFRTAVDEADVFPEPTTTIELLLGQTMNVTAHRQSPQLFGK